MDYKLNIKNYEYSKLNSEDKIIELILENKKILIENDDLKIEDAKKNIEIYEPRISRINDKMKNYEKDYNELQEYLSDRNTKPVTMVSDITIKNVTHKVGLIFYLFASMAFGLFLFLFKVWIKEVLKE
jgi:hypothetical protein